MDPDSFVVPLADAAALDAELVGGKAATLARLVGAGFRVPAGFCLTVRAYERMVAAGDLATVIGMELGRKPLESMRWEELWDAALRIRSAFLATPMPPEIAAAIADALRPLGPHAAVAVRSSAPGEDAAPSSFAGLHESLVGVAGEQAVADAVRLVWASLWSDAALLYRRELALDPARSRMAVVVQLVVDGDRSGVAFGRDPTAPAREVAIVEAVPGRCSDLVDGVTDPDRWVLERWTGRVLAWRPGRRGGSGEAALLGAADLATILETLRRVESLLGCAPDIEWTGRGEALTLLQARPVTTAGAGSDDARAFYRGLRPGLRRLQALRERVVGTLIPELEREGERLAAEELEGLDDGGLARVLDERLAAVERWKRIYRDDFIPLAHGVRMLGVYYGDAVRPQDPYEFVGLLRGERFIAARRNEAIAALARRVRAAPALLGALRATVAGDAKDQAERLRQLGGVAGGAELLRDVEAILTEFMDVEFGHERLVEHPELLLCTVLEMAQAPAPGASAGGPAPVAEAPPPAVLEQRLLDAVGPARQAEAREMLALGRTSWRLRDDDNVLVGRVESQLLRAVHVAAARLETAGRCTRRGVLGEHAAAELARALRDPRRAPIVLPDEGGATPPAGAVRARAGEHPRQLVGQPASPGLATATACRVDTPADLGRFRAGEILVCDAIQPAMTHVVPLASGIVERRGGMLIHGAIIARELGVPCVNGVADAVELIAHGELVTVDGYLGIVTVGAPELALELPASPGAPPVR